MSLKTMKLNGTWKLTGIDHDPTASFMAETQTTPWLDCQVPGDIHPALETAGLIPDPFLNQNVEACSWVASRDWWYRQEVAIPKTFTGQSLQLVFDGIDTFATVYVNDAKVGETENSFLQYRFDVTDIIRPGETNFITVCIHATRSVLEKRDTSKYAACFYTPRIFGRKAQCHFSWDWAPNLPAIGIWQDVRLEARDPGIIEEVQIRTQTDGHVQFIIGIDNAGKNLVKKEKKVWTLNIAIHKGRDIVAKEIPVIGGQNFAHFTLPNPELWWPRGYGQPHLYGYTITLSDGRHILHEISGRFGIRKVELIERGNEDETQSFRFRVNGQDIFCMGSNWVPADCFPGTVTDERYRHLIRLACEAHTNMIRIWGGGIYEKDIFYDLCDEHGIMVWQDLMFACSDIPDDDLEWTFNLLPEFEYQIKRLRNHPCLTHWCGGNEKTGTYAEMIHYGDKITRYLARGVVQDLCPDIAYTPSSPYSITDVGNEPQSGDTHGGTYEPAFRDDMRRFRKHIDRKQAVFMSEFGMHGPPAMRSLKKFISAEHLWPQREVWEYHVQDNPYNDLKETFLDIQRQSAALLFYEPASAADFVKVAGTLYAEYLYAEFQHHRRRQPHNSGALIWMLADCWPCASWAVIDYYGLPKQPYYALKRACQPIVLSFREVADGWELYLTHSLLASLDGQIEVFQQTVDNKTRKVLHEQKVKAGPHSSMRVVHIPAANVAPLANSYLSATIQCAGQKVTEVFFHNLWKDIAWCDPEIKMTPGSWGEKDGEYELTVTLSAGKFARCVNLSLADELVVYYSDNFFDMLPGESKGVVLRSANRFDPGQLRLNHWLTDWD